VFFEGPSNTTLAKALAAGDMLCGGSCLRSAYGPQLVIVGRFWRRWVRAGHAHIPNADQHGPMPCNA
jgi:hypothetical protein